SHVRAHQHSAGIKDQDISKSIGGNSSKIHLAVDADGNPIEIIISDGTIHDVKIAPKMIEKLDLSETEVCCADKGYDSESLRE
uniref:transposase n=3 Tax=Acinetobacter TaxID=469 RepID=UPI0011781F63